MRKWEADDVPIPDGLCADGGCVFIADHTGPHSWTRPGGKMRP